MNKRYFFCLSAMCFGLLLLSNGSGAPTSHTGAPGEQTCGRSVCHNSPVNVGNAQFEIALADSIYTPGESYVVNVSFTNNNLRRNGFQIVALDNDDNMAGSWTLTNETLTRIRMNTALNRSYVTHTRDGADSSQWSFVWDAPADDVGNITFYAAGNDANGNGDNTGDLIYTTTQLFRSSLTSIDESHISKISVFPNPSADYIYFENAPAKLRVDVYDLNGRQVLHTENVNGINVTDWNPGSYILQLSYDQVTDVRKVLVK